jgi:hypothetical protein
MEKMDRNRNATPVSNENALKISMEMSLMMTK